MDRATAVNLAQAAIKAQNKRLVEAVLQQEAARKASGAEQARGPIESLPLIAVTCATGWECYAITEELVKTRKFRVRALYRTEGTQAAQRLERLKKRVDETDPGLLTLRPQTDLYSPQSLSDAFRDCFGVVIYVTANTGKAGKIDSHGTDPVGGRRAVMRQVSALIPAIKANPSIEMSVMVNYPTDKVSGLVPEAPQPPWYVQQRLRLPKFFREQGINLTCIHRPAYYYAMHRVDYTAQADIRGNTQLARTTIREDNIPGIMPPEFMVNWVDVRDVGKWCGTCFEYPDVFKNQDFSMASTALTGHQLVEIAQRINKYGTTFKYKQFPQWLMKTLLLFTSEVSYPLHYSQWYADQTNAYDFASIDDLADLARIHPPWTFERKLKEWGIDEIRPRAKSKTAPKLTASEAE